MVERTHEKIAFPLSQDADGYPPFDTETLWGVQTSDGLYKLDSIPFFVKNISLDDIVSVKRVGNQLVFDKLIVPSNNSVFRVLMLEGKAAKGLQDNLVSLGCEWEGTHIPSLFAVHMPPTADWGAIEEVLLSGIARDLWEIEEASMRIGGA